MAHKVFEEGLAELLGTTIPDRVAIFEIICESQPNYALHQKNLLAAHGIAIPGTGWVRYMPPGNISRSEDNQVDRVEQIPGIEDNSLYYLITDETVSEGSTLAVAILVLIGQGVRIDHIYYFGLWGGSRRIYLGKATEFLNSQHSGQLQELYRII